MSDEKDGPPKTAAASLRTLRMALTATRAADAASAHPLGAAGLGAARTALATSLLGLRGAANATFSASSYPGGERVAAVQADAARRREHVSTVRDALGECRDHARRMDPFAPSYTVVMHRVKGAGEAAGAQTVEDLGATKEIGPRGVPGPQLSVYAETFLADFQFYPRDVTVIFRHFTATGGQEICDKEIDADFERLVRSERFGDLQVAFHLLVKQEALDKAMKPFIQLKDSLRFFEDDLLSMQAAERAAVPGLSDDDYRDKGVGIIKRSAHGLRIMFADGWHAILGVEDAYPRRSIVNSPRGPTARPGSIQLPVKFDFAPSTPMVEVGAQYVLTLSQPLVTTTTFAASLEQSSALSGCSGSAGQSGHPGGGADPMNHGQSSNTGPGGSRTSRIQGQPRNKTPGSSTVGRGSAGGVPPLRGSSSVKRGRPTLEGLLSPSVLGQSEEVLLDRNAGSGIEVDGLSGEGEVFTRAAVPGKKFFKFSYCRNEAVPGVHIYRIPVSSPENILGALEVLRQQLVFNALFSSCFSTSAFVPEKAEAVIQQPIEVVVSNAPQFIHFSVYDGVADGVLGVGVTIGLNGVVHVKLRGPKGKPCACSDAKATALLTAAYNVPIAINAMRTVEERARSGAGAGVNSAPVDGDGNLQTLNPSAMGLRSVSVGDVIMNEIGLAAVGGGP